MLFEQTELLEHDATGHGVGRRVLRADTDLENLCVNRDGHEPDGCGDKQGQEAREFGRRADAHRTNPFKPNCAGFCAMPKRDAPTAIAEGG
jgi:hypothetical protein